MLWLFFQAEDGIRDYKVTGVQTCALPISNTDGLNGQTLKTNGSGIVSWQNDSINFVAGNGLSFSNDSLNSTWTQKGNNIFNNNSGNVGVNNNTPVSQFQVSNGAILFDGTAGGVPVTGAGTRLMWVPSSGALRAGEATGGEWDNGNVGEASFAPGNTTTASGYVSVATGNGTNAIGDYSQASGY